jgi:uncharacterized protein (DUF2062 family)
MPSPSFSFIKLWRERVIGLIVAQLIQGVTPQKIALTIALGFTLGIFPILGATTALCAIAGVWLKLNQPVIQTMNWVISPIQLSLILVFVRIGEWIMRAPRVSFSVPGLIQKFDQNPIQFMRQFGMTGVHGMVAWLFIAPFLAVAIYAVLLPPLKKIAALKASVIDTRHVK